MLSTFILFPSQSEVVPTGAVGPPGPPGPPGTPGTQITKEELLEEFRDLIKGKILLQKVGKIITNNQIVGNCQRPVFALGVSQPVNILVVNVAR